MTTIEEQFKQYETEDEGWKRLHEEIRKESKIRESYVAKTSINSNLNRYNNVIPFDATRVKLLREGDTDYINASYVNVSKAARRYILTQGPLPQTIGHFWLMVWEQKSNIIVMLNRIVEIEAFLKITKCEQYWPQEGQVDFHKDVNIEVSLEATEMSKDYTIRIFNIRSLDTQESRKVHQYNYTAWPDHGCPESPASILKLLSAVRKSGGMDKLEEPAIIHCSAGIGRSGTFVLIDSILAIIENGTSSDKVNIIETLHEMRECRKGLVQTSSQLRFAYMTILYGKSILELAMKSQPSSGKSVDLSPRESPRSRDSSKSPTVSTSSASRCTWSTENLRKSRKRKRSLNMKGSMNQAFDEVDSDTADSIFRDMMSSMLNMKKPKNELESNQQVDWDSVKAQISARLEALISGKDQTTDLIQRNPPIPTLARIPETATTSGFIDTSSDSALLLRREKRKQIVHHDMSIGENEDQTQE